MHVLMKKIESANLEAFGYDPEQLILFIRFKSTGLYLYHKVPATTVDEFQAAESKGGFFHQKIKNSFQFTRVTDEPVEKKTNEVVPTLPTPNIPAS